MHTGSWSGTRRPFPPKTRKAILTAGGYTCSRCGHHDLSGASLEADHIVPAAEGGTDHPDNGQPLCKPCHHRKTQTEIRRGQQRRPSRKRPATTKHPGLIEP